MHWYKKLSLALIAITITTFCAQSIYGDFSLNEYSSYLKQLGLPNGSYAQGEIEIITDPEEITKVEQIQKNRLLKKGFSEESAHQFSRVGIVSEDQYLILLRDAVYFPNGIPGTYDRLIWKSELTTKFPGVAVLPILPSGQIVLNLNYRHATRSWELELPRGGILPNETIEETALRELKEETGLSVSSLSFLGNMAPDTGILSSIIPVFTGTVSQVQNADIEYSEAIAGIIAFTKEEIKTGLIQGFLEVSVLGKIQKVPLRDPFLTFALLQSELRETR